jgi:transglutaminase-like putative cysteine protease
MKAVATKEHTAATVLPPSAITELALVAVSVAAILGLSRLFDGGSWLRPCLIAALSSHAIAILLRRLGVGIVLALPTALIAGIVTITLLRYGSTTHYWLPTHHTWEILREDIREASQQFSHVRPPAPVLPGFLAVLMAMLWMFSFIADWFAFRLRVGFESLIPTITIVVLVAMLGVHTERGFTIIIYLAAGVLFMALHRADRLREPVGWVRTGAPAPTFSVLPAASVLTLVALAAATAIAPALPWANSAAIVKFNNGAAGDRFTVSPLVDIRGKLTDRTNAEAFVVTASAPSYWRLTSLDAFDGNVWSSSRSYENAASSLPVTPNNVQRIPVHQAFVIDKLSSVWLPVAATPIRVSGIAGARFDAETGALEVADPSPVGLQYEVDSVVLVPNIQQLQRTAQRARAIDVAQYTSLPANFPATVKAEALRITASATTEYDKARALQDYFLTGFTYDLNVASGQDNHAIERFLFTTKRGYCEQFAGTYAAMARSIGLPARVAVGFTPGLADAAGRYHVSGKYAHAWPEVYFPSVGWVPFEPTPGRGNPGFESVTGRPAAQVTTPASTDTAAPVTSPGATTTTTSKLPADPNGSDSSGAGGTTAAKKSSSRAGLLQIVVTALALALGAFLLFGGIVIVLKRAQRWYRRRRAVTPRAAAVVAWNELETAWRQRGIVASAGTTRTEFAAGASTALGERRGPLSAHELTQTARSVDLVVFGPEAIEAGLVRRIQERTASAIRLVGELDKPIVRWLRLIDPRPLIWTSTRTAGTTAIRRGGGATDHASSDDQTPVGSGASAP